MIDYCQKHHRYFDVDFEDGCKFCEVQPEPNQEEIDTEAASILTATFCFKHKRAMDFDEVYYCPDCDAEKLCLLKGEHDE